MVQQDLYVLIRQTTILKQETIDELIVELECAAEGLHVPCRELVVHQTQLSVHDFSEQRNCQVAIFLARLEVVVLGFGLESHA